MKIGFIGAGNMGGALATAVAKNSDCEVYLSDLNQEKLKELADKISAKISTNGEIAKICDIIFLAVKPKFVSELISSIEGELSERDGYTVVSMAAGISLSAIEKMSQVKMPVIRIMPNTPVSVGKGVILTSANGRVSEKTLAEFQRLMKFAGDVEIIDEALIDAGTALSGCSPAFVYMFIEALADGAVEAGFPRDKAQEYAAKTLIGASTLLLESGKHPGELKDAVCSPGGSTIEGVHALEEGAMRGVVSRAVLASYKKTKELGNK